MRIYYRETTGEYLPSVSTILRLTETKAESDRLRKWRHQMAKIHGEAGANLAITEAQKLGIATHEAIRDFLYGKLKKHPETAIWSNLMPALKLIKSDWHECEKTVWWEGKHPYAGRLDIVCDWHDQLTLLDWKTSQRTKIRAWLKRDFLQTAAYAKAYQQRSRKEITQLCIVAISPQRMQIFTEPFRNWEKKWDDRCKKFYKFADENWEKINSDPELQTVKLKEEET